jgi:hypothetical protein
LHRETDQLQESVVTRITIFLLSGVLLCASIASGAQAQQINGKAGSPSATTTIDGKQLPPSKFGGVIKEDAKESAPEFTA